MKVAITGATGFVGSRLVEQLQARGDQPLILTRNRDAALKAFPNLEVVAYNPTESGSWQEAISGCDAVVHLAGEPIAESRWTPKQKQEILNSRQLSTQKIVEAIVKANPKPAVLVNASAIGYYGTSETATFEETSASGNDFFGRSLSKVGNRSQKSKRCWCPISNSALRNCFGGWGCIGEDDPPI